MKSKLKGLKLFAWFTLIVLILTITVFAVLYNRKLNLANGAFLDSSSEIDALSSMLSLFLGSAVGIGGAIATIYLASLGISISERQELIEKQSFYDEKMNSSIEIFSEIILSVSNLFSSSILIFSRIPETNEENILTLAQSPMPKGLKKEMEEFSNNLSELNSSIKRLILNSFAYGCFRDNSKDNSSGLKHIYDFVSRTHIDGSSFFGLSVSNLNEVYTWINLSKRKIEDIDMVEFLNVYLYGANGSTIPMFNRTNLSDAGIRRFLFCGALIQIMTQCDKKAKSSFIANYGAAILYDIIKAIPSDKQLSKYFNEKYPMNEFKSIKKKYDFKVTSQVSQSLNKVMENKEKLVDLFLLCEEEHNGD